MTLEIKIINIKWRLCIWTFKNINNIWILSMALIKTLQLMQVRILEIIQTP